MVVKSSCGLLLPLLHGIHLKPPKKVWHTCVDGLKVCQHALYLLLVRTLQVICVAKTTNELMSITGH